MGQAAATLILTGIALVVQLVVYPGLITVGRSAPGIWQQVHDAHSRRISVAVGLPWLLQGVTCALLPFVHPAHTPLCQPLLAGLLGLASVGLTVGWAVPLHRGLGDGYDDRQARALLRANGCRLACWAAAGVLSLVMIG